MVSTIAVTTSCYDLIGRTMAVETDGSQSAPGKHLGRNVRQSMPTATCPVQVYINEARRQSRAGSIVSWSMAALRGTLQDKCESVTRAGLVRR